MKEYMLTTVDNPYNPFVQFDEWNAFDESKGYFTLSYLARRAQTSIMLSDSDYSLEINRAIEQIVEDNCLGLYIKVCKEDFE